MVDDYFVKATPSCGCVKLPDEIFLNKLPDYYNASAPKVKTRSIFTWGNPINDDRAYIDNMARLRLNQLIIWNDYAPINAKDVVKVRGKDEQLCDIGMETILKYGIACYKK